MAQKAVVHFHDQLNAENYQQIYSESHTEFQAAINESKAIEYFSAARRKLGKVRSAQLNDWKPNNANGRTLIGLFYETRFDEDTAREEFIWAVNGNNAVLFRYNIDSPTLVTK